MEKQDEKRTVVPEEAEKEERRPLKDSEVEAAAGGRPEYTKPIVWGIHHDLF